MIYLDGQRHRLATSEAQAGDAACQMAITQRVEQGREQTRSRGPKRMP